MERMESITKSQNPMTSGGMGLRPEGMAPVFGFLDWGIRLLQ